jgi:hypothetical protein
VRYYVLWKIGKAGTHWAEEGPGGLLSCSSRRYRFAICSVVCLSDDSATAREDAASAER